MRYPSWILFPLICGSIRFFAFVYPSGPKKFRKFFMNNRIRVVCRKRPLNRRESSSRYADVVSCVESAVLVREPKVKVDLTRYTEEHTFQFDGSFDDDATNEDLYDSCVSPLIEGFLTESAKCTCFCFGQTGSGKTYVLPMLSRISCLQIHNVGHKPVLINGKRSARDISHSSHEFVF